MSLIVELLEQTVGVPWDSVPIDKVNSSGAEICFFYGRQAVEKLKGLLLFREALYSLHRILGERVSVKKLSEYVKTAKAVGILGVSPNTLRTWAVQGKLPMHRNPANGYRPFKQADGSVLARSREADPKQENGRIIPVGDKE
ncbi:MAG: MerR family transcriptional regulator [Planctomycetaceae bacterium]